MRKLITKATVIILLGATTIMMTGCYGSFSLVRKLHDWNGTISNSKFVNELVFFGLCIIPAYELSCLGDALIFNSIEFWGGQNPIAMNNNEIEDTSVMHKGVKYEIIKKQNSLTIAQNDNNISVNFRYFPKEKTWYLMEGENKVKVVELKGNEVFTYLPNDKTLVFDLNTVDQIETEVMASK